MASIEGYTDNYNLVIPAFDFPNWHVYYKRNLKTLDAIIYMITGTSHIKGFWANSTVYIVGDRVVDPDNQLYYKCLVAHTSAATGTFTDDFTANPTYWEEVELSLLTDNNTWTGSNDFTGGSIDVPTQSSSNNTTKAASTAMVQAAISSAFASSSPTGALQNKGTVTGTTNTTGVMMGYAVSFTPTITNRMMMILHVQIISSAVDVYAGMQLVVGTGTAPANGAAATGNAISAAQYTYIINTSQFIPVTLIGIVIGNIGTTYWFDLKLWSSSGAATVTPQNAFIQVLEVA